ncbi:MAG: type II toxin-antitoxin system antitoxin SocA domain-containing protein [Candidatus Kapaibacterium sp.]
MKKIIDSPYANGKAELMHETSNETFRKEVFKVRKYFYKCKKTGKEFTTSEAGDLNIIQIFNMYRERKKILFPEQIIEMRERYGLSAAKMSVVLGFGANTYSNYEKGEIPNDSNSTLLNQAYKPKGFLSIIKEKEDLFSEKQIQTLCNRIEEIIIQRKSFCLRDYLFSDNTKPTEFTGYKMPNFEKIENAVIYFLQNPYTYITRLNKLLFYSDFLSFSETGYSITGLRYAAIDNGPVPNNYNLLYSILEKEGAVNCDNVVMKDYEFSKYEPLKKFDKEIFESEEIEIFKRVLRNFKFEKTSNIINLSHEEEGWKKNIKTKGLISYKEYGFELKAF